MYILGSTLSGTDKALMHAETCLLFLYAQKCLCVQAVSIHRHWRRSRQNQALDVFSFGMVVWSTFTINFIPLDC